MIFICFSWYSVLYPFLYSRCTFVRTLVSFVVGRGTRLLVVVDGDQFRHGVAADKEGEVLVLLPVSQRVDDLLLLPGTTNHEEAA